MDTNDPVLQILQMVAAMEQRLNLLEEAQRKKAGACATDEGMNFTLREARFHALYDVVRELSAREGISEERLTQHVAALVNFHRDRLLRLAENINPRWAAQIDNRGPGDDPAPEPPPSLFCGKT